LFNKLQHAENQEIDLSLFSVSNGTLTLRREDLIHPFISGNKFRKLKYNLLKAKDENQSILLTFGGAFSNHIAAVAYAGKISNIKTIGFIRGEELQSKINENPTLSFAQSCGMTFHFISRSRYRTKNDSFFLDELHQLFGNFYLIPEGGTNEYAVKGCEEIISSKDIAYDFICSAVGTGGTLAGIVRSSNSSQKVIGFSALKGIFLTSEIKKYTSKENYTITDEYCFGGYAKIDVQLIRFINEFNEKTGILLDPIYTGKMMYGIIDMLKRKKFKENSRILAIHTGGLQGISGMNDLLKRKNLPQIII
jgi:1-aminocyclopropane-1-carboxylate deaminase